MADAAAMTTLQTPDTIVSAKSGRQTSMPGSEAVPEADSTPQYTPGDRVQQKQQHAPPNDAHASGAESGPLVLVTGAELEELLKESGMPLKIMVRSSDAPASETNAYYRAEVLAVDRRGRRMQLRYQYYGDKQPYWLPITSPRMWRGTYPLCESVWTNLGKVGEGGMTKSAVC